ncbi:MAG: pyruvate kinase [Candidatus Eremiobacteraeota bacterium]|nr:pyruvate kinase [Candidatus Eremiobacteraeota bacterium]
MLIATLPLLPRYRHDIVRSPVVDQLRYNTVMPIDVEIITVVEQLLELAGEKPLWIDLKCRQLRITKFSYLPYDYVEISHPITVNMPTKLYFKDCVADIESVVNGTRLILAERPLRTVGAGEPVNILDPSLRIEGFLTEQDRAYIEAAKSLGLHRYMLSFVERREDIEELLSLDPDAEIIAKIESKRGIDFVERDYPSYRHCVRLMAARDDLYINLGEEKVQMLPALYYLVSQDPQAIAASRLLTSLYEKDTPAMGDLADLHMLHLMGYRSFMLSDEICRIRDVFRKVAEIYGEYLEFLRNNPFCSAE